MDLVFHISNFVSLIEGTNFDYIITEKNIIKYTNVKGANIETCKLIIAEQEKNAPKNILSNHIQYIKRKFVCILELWNGMLFFLFDNSKERICYRRHVLQQLISLVKSSSSDCGDYKSHYFYK
ncbi:MAG: hypothetical protein ACLU3D_09695 [Acutalibacteraceae bacterium]